MENPWLSGGFFLDKTHQADDVINKDGGSQSQIPIQKTSYTNFQMQQL